ncbi:MAG: ZIP family metal transporter [Bacilli bacterium]|nr:ZIP family metal transporter [Bacilli bacterium]
MYDWFVSQTIIIKTLLASLFTFGLTTLGSSIVFFFKKVNKTFMDGMLSLAAGIMLAAAFWSLLEPGISLAQTLKFNGWLIALIGVMSGGLLLYLGDAIYDSHSISRDSTKNKRIAMLIFSITIHNIPEGLAVGVAFGSLKYNIPGATLLAAVSLAVGIGIQNFPEGSAISLPLRREGYSRFKSFIIGSLSGIVEPIAAVIGAILVLKTRYILPFFLTFAAGAMIYVVTKEIIPESQQNEKKDLMTIFTIIGFTIMMVLDVALG